MSEEERAGYKGDTIDLVHLEQNGVARNVSELLTQIKQDGLLAIQNLRFYQSLIVFSR